VLGVLLNRGSSSALRFLLNILIGRSLGPTGLGTYYLFDTWQRLLGFGGSLGLPQLVLRSVSVMEGRGQRQAAHRVLMRSLRTVALATGGLALLATLLAPLIAGRLLGKPELSWLLPLAGLGAIWLALIQLLARALNGRTRPNLSLALENSALPAGLVLILAGGLLLGVPFTAQRLLRLYVGVGAAATGLGLLLWRLTGQPRRGEELTQPVPGFERREMATFWLLGMVNVASNNLAYLILPQLVSTAEIGLFGASQRFVTMAVTIASALGALFATRFARHFAEGDQEALRHDLVLSQALSLLAYAPFVLAYLFLPGPLLAILGAEFQQASGILRILVFGQLVNAAGGLSSLGLQMSRDEGALLRLNLYFLVVNALAIGGLGWGFGLAGAAWGQSLALAGRHLAIYLRARVTLRAAAAEARR
jgi:PST family polysaccharide transporter